MGEVKKIKKRKICVLSGKRGGFGALIPTMQLIESDPDLEFSLVVTDQHLYHHFGYTVKEVEKWFKVMYKVDMEQNNGTPRGRSKAIGVCLTKITDILSEISPDIVVILGDRGEVLATAIAAINLGIPIAHIQGGDISGSIDEMVRHAVTKLSHIHLVSTEHSAQRVIGLGEEPWRVHIVGDPHIDMILQGKCASIEEIHKKFNINVNDEAIVVLQHSVSTEPDLAYDQMKNTMEAVTSFNKRTIVVYPCSDQGYEGIVKAIYEFESYPNVSIYKNIEAPLFWGLLSISKTLVGNSSAGLIETPYFRIPAVNIGKRQTGRQHAENVIHVDHDLKAIKDAIEKALYDKSFSNVVRKCSRPYGDSPACGKIVRILKEVELNERLMEKRMTY